MKKITTLMMALACCGTMSLSAQDKIELVNLFAEDQATIYNVSENGAWASGYKFDNSDNKGWNVNASKWDLKTGKRTQLATEDEGESTASCVSNDGTIVAGSYLFQPAYNLNGKWHRLELPQGFTMGLVNSMAIVGKDTIMVGRIQDNGEATRLIACRWINGKYEQLDSDLRRDRLGDVALTNCIYDISSDGKTMLGGLNYNVWMGHVTTFVIKDGKSSIIEYDNFDKDLVVDLCMIRGPYMSPNGKYFVGDFWHATEDPSSDYLTEVEYPMIYDIENNRAQILKNAGGYMACAVDDYGHIYISPSGIPASDPYIYKNDQPVKIKDILLSNGVTEAQLKTLIEPEYGNVGMFMDCSADGTTFVCCSGPCAIYNWAARLPKNIYDMNTTAAPVISNDNLAVFYTGNTLLLSGMVDHIEVYDINGAQIMNENVESAFVPASLETGLYIVKLYNYTSNTITTSKVLVR